MASWEEEAPALLASIRSDVMLADGRLQGYDPRATPPLLIADLDGTVARVLASGGRRALMWTGMDTVHPELEEVMRQSATAS